MTISPRQIAEQKQSALIKSVVPKLKTTVDKIVELDKQIAKLKDRRAVLVTERQRLSRLVYETPTFERRSGTGQGLFVHTRYFLPYVEAWIEDYDTLHGQGARTILAKRAAVSTKNIRSYFNGSITYAGIMSVDRILTAIGREDVLDSLPWKTTAELKIGARKNPPQPPATHYYEE